MTLLPMQLSRPNPEHVQALYARAQAHEKVFRNILEDCLTGFTTTREKENVQTDSLDDVFRHYVNTEGGNLRVGEFVVGPCVTDGFPASFHGRSLLVPRFPSAKLENNEALVVLEISNLSFMATYRILDDASVAGIAVQQHKQY